MAARWACAWVRARSSLAAMASTDDSSSASRSAVESGCTGRPWPSARPARIRSKIGAGHAAADAERQQQRKPEQRRACVQEGPPGLPQRRLHLGQRRPSGYPPAGHLGPVERLQRALALEVGGRDDALGAVAVLAQPFPGYRLADVALGLIRAGHVDVLAVGHGCVPAFRQFRRPQQLRQPLRIERHDQRIRNVIADAHRHADREYHPARDRAAEQIRDVGLSGLPDDVGDRGLGLADRKAARRAAAAC